MYVVLVRLSIFGVVILSYHFTSSLWIYVCIHCIYVIIFQLFSVYHRMITIVITVNSIFCTFCVYFCSHFILSVHCDTYEFVITSTPVTVWSIAISLSVCLSVCLSVYPLEYLKTTRPNFLYMLAHLWPWLGHSLTAMQYVSYFRFCERRLTPCLHIMKQMGQNQRRHVCLVQCVRWRHCGRLLLHSIDSLLHILQTPCLTFCLILSVLFFVDLSDMTNTLICDVNIMCLI